MFKCPICGKTFDRRNNLVRHKERQHAPGFVNYRCDICKTGFKTRRIWRRHVNSKHGRGSVAAGDSSEDDGEEEEEERVRTERILETSPDELYTLAKVSKFNSTRFRTACVMHTFQMQSINVYHMANVIRILYLIFESLISKITHGMHPNDLIRFTINEDPLLFLSRKPLSNY